MAILANFHGKYAQILAKALHTHHAHQCMHCTQFISTIPAHKFFLLRQRCARHTAGPQRHALVQDRLQNSSNGVCDGLRGVSFPIKKENDVNVPRPSRTFEIVCVLSALLFAERNEQLCYSLPPNIIHYFQRSPSLGLSHPHSYPPLEAYHCLAGTRYLSIFVHSAPRY